MLYKQLLNLYYNFKHHILSHHPKKILTLNNFLQLRKKIIIKTSKLNPKKKNIKNNNPPKKIEPPKKNTPPKIKIKKKKIYINLLIITT